MPIIGIVDTNIKYHYYNLPILANDDSLDSLTYISGLLSKHILLNKYKKLMI
jgi:ribosomal protein S2